MDSSCVEAAFRLICDEDRFMMARGMVIARNGEIVAETYPHDPGDRLRIANLQSCTKSFTSVCLGIKNWKWERAKDGVAFGALWWSPRRISRRCTPHGRTPAGSTSTISTR